MGVDFNELIENEVKSRIKSIVDENKKLKNKVTSLTDECTELKSKLLEVDDKASIIETGKNIMSCFSEQNIESFIKLKPTCAITMSDSGMNSIPMWFYMIVKYWKNKIDIYNIFKFFNFNIPDWAKDIKMPQEWNKEDCIGFVKTIKNHYVCNGQIYSHNIGFWFRDQGQKLSNTQLMMSKQYSEIPWQFVLANPLWLSDNDVFNEMIECISSGKDHSAYFLEIENYGNKLSPEQLKFFVKAVVNGHNKNKRDNSYSDFIRKNIRRIEFTKNDKLIIEFILSSGLNAQPHADAPDTIHIYYIENNLKELKDKISYIEDCKKFTKTKKAELIKDCVIKKYNTTNIAKSLLEEEE